MVDRLRTEDTETYEAQHNKIYKMTSRSPQRLRSACESIQYDQSVFCALRTAKDLKILYEDSGDGADEHADLCSGAYVISSLGSFVLRLTYKPRHDQTS